MAFTAGGRFNFITAKGATSVQEEHFHSVYFAAGTAICHLPRANIVYCAEPLREAGRWSCRRCSRDVREFSLPSFSQFARCGVFRSTRCASTGVTTGCRVLSLCPLIVLFPRRTGRSSVEVGD